MCACFHGKCFFLILRHASRFAVSTGWWVEAMVGITAMGEVAGPFVIWDALILILYILIYIYICFLITFVGFPGL